MLILTRKINESILIDNEIEIKICQIDQNQVKIGIQAPKDIRIIRAEVMKRLAKTPDNIKSDMG